jgi:hypothetical protein
MYVCALVGDRRGLQLVLNLAVTFVAIELKLRRNGLSACRIITQPHFCGFLHCGNHDELGFQGNCFSLLFDFDGHGLSCFDLMCYAGQMATTVIT